MMTTATTTLMTKMMMMMMMRQLTVITTAMITASTVLLQLKLGDRRSMDRFYRWMLRARSLYLVMSRCLYLSCDDCLEGMSRDYQNCSVLYSVLYSHKHTHEWFLQVNWVLFGSGLGFCVRVYVCSSVFFLNYSQFVLG